MKKKGPTRLRTFAADLCPRTMHDRNHAQHNNEHHQSAQQLVRNARRHIIEPVLASFDLASDSYDVEQLSMAPDSTHEKEKLPCIRLRNRGGLTIHASGVHIRWDIGDESADVDNAMTDSVPSAEPPKSPRPTTRSRRLPPARTTATTSKAKPNQSALLYAHPRRQSQEREAQVRGVQVGVDCFRATPRANTFRKS